jgi:DNA integrity scanning protein DisA with diadenylate cyclase activity
MADENKNTALNEAEKQQAINQTGGLIVLTDAQRLKQLDQVAQGEPSHLNELKKRLNMAR